MESESSSPAPKYPVALTPEEFGILRRFILLIKNGGLRGPIAKQIGHDGLISYDLAADQIKDLVQNGLSPDEMDQLVHHAFELSFLAGHARSAVNGVLGPKVIAECIPDSDLAGKFVEKLVDDVYIMADELRRQHDPVWNLSATELHELKGPR